MKIITDKKAKLSYRSIEIELFNPLEIDPWKVIKQRYRNNINHPHDWLGEESLYQEIHSLFKNFSNSFYISTCYKEDPIFEFDFREDHFREYYGIMIYPKSIGVNCIDPEAGLYITKERVFFYSKDKSWCLFSDRYKDIIILAY